MLKMPGLVRIKIAALLTAATVAWAGNVVPASAVTFSTDGSGSLSKPTASGGSCPTLSNVRPLEVWYNLSDMDKRGFGDPGNQEPWPLMVKTAQVICGAAQGAKIRVGMFFLRALGTMTSAGLGSRPETDPEVVYNALEWVHKNRGVTITIVLESKPTPKSARNQISTRLKNIASVYYCSYGCLTTAKKTTFPYAINHEKIIAIDHTVWGNSDGNAGSDNSAVLSSSGNWARSQTRSYYQESVLIYGDARYQKLVADRVDTMLVCARTGCKTNKSFPADEKNWLKKKRNIWVDPLYQHPSNPGRGTTLSFAPAPTSMRDYYVQAFDKVDCTVQNRIRVAMFRMTDEASKKIVSSLARLKGDGCDVKIVLTSPVGGYSVSSYLKKKIKNAGIWLKCSPVPLHTKLVLIGSSTGNEAKIVTSTATMGVVSLTQSDEHTTTFDSTRATIPGYAEAIRRAYGVYAAGWTEIATQARSC